MIGRLSAGRSRAGEVWSEGRPLREGLGPFALWSEIDGERVSEMARVCKPGGEVLIINQFARDRGALAMAERAAAPFADLLGWHSDFAIDRVLGEMSLVLEEKRPLPPFGMFTFLRQRKGDRLNFLRSSGRHFRSSSIDLTGRQT